MTCAVAVLLAEVSATIAAVAVAVAICTWTSNPGQIIPGRRR